MNLSISFSEDWWYRNHNIVNDESYWLDPYNKMVVDQKKKQILYDRFGDIGLGENNPPLICIHNLF